MIVVLSVDVCSPNMKKYYCNLCFTIATNSEEYLSSNAKTSGSLVRPVADAWPGLVCVSDFSLVIRLSAGSNGILSTVAKLLELVVVVEVVVSVVAAIFSWVGYFFMASESTVGGLVLGCAFSLAATLALHFFHLLRYLVYQFTDWAFILETAEATAATIWSSSPFSSCSHLARLCIKLYATQYINNRHDIHICTSLWISINCFRLKSRSLIRFSTISRWDSVSDSDCQNTYQEVTHAHHKVYYSYYCHPLWLHQQ